MAESPSRLTSQISIWRSFCVAFSLFALVWMTPFLQRAEAQVSQYDLAARITFLLSKYSTWPANPGEDGLVLVGVYGNGAANFAALNGEILKGNKIKVVTITAQTPPEDISRCAIVFTSRGGDLDRVANATENEPVFLVHLGAGNGKAGVSLFEADGKLAFDVNLGAMKKRKLKMSSQALKLASSVNK